MSDSAIKIERVYSSATEVVFDAWTSCEALKQWHCGTIAEVKMDVIVGGEFFVRFEPEEGCDHQVVRGHYLEVDRPTRVRYSWKWDGSEMEDSVVTIDFVAQGPASTLVRLVHEKLDSQKLRDDHAQGWNACLSGLEEFVGQTQA